MRRRPVLPAICAVMLLVVGQLVAFAHEAEERHVTCAEHGEQLEGVELGDPLHACEHDHFISVDDEGGEHEDCAIARALRQSSAPPSMWAVPAHASVVTATPSTLARDVPPSVKTLYRIAPKTSPPV